MLFFLLLAMLCHLTQGLTRTVILKEGYYSFDLICPSLCHLPKLTGLSLIHFLELTFSFFIYIFYFFVIIGKDICVNIPCMNGGFCSIYDDNVRCDCNGKYEGENMRKRYDDILCSYRTGIYKKNIFPNHLKIHPSFCL